MAQAQGQSQAWVEGLGQLIPSKFIASEQGGQKGLPGRVLPSHARMGQGVRQGRPQLES
jgi:hypothetical protein